MSPPPSCYDDELDEEVFDEYDEDDESEDASDKGSEIDFEPPTGVLWPDPFDAGTETSSQTEDEATVSKTRLRPSLRSRVLPSASSGQLASASQSSSSSSSAATQGRGTNAPPRPFGTEFLQHQPSNCNALNSRDGDRPWSRNGLLGAGELRGQKRKGPEDTADQQPQSKWRRESFDMDVQDEAPDFTNMSSLEMNGYVRWWRKMHALTWEARQDDRPEASSSSSGLHAGRTQLESGVASQLPLQGQPEKADSLDEVRNHKEASHDRQPNPEGDGSQKVLIGALNSSRP